MYHYFQHIPKHTETIKLHLNILSWQNLGSCICHHPFPLPHCCGISDLPSVVLVAQTIGWIAQTFPVKLPCKIAMSCWRITSCDWSFGLLQECLGGRWLHNRGSGNCYSWVAAHARAQLQTNGILSSCEDRANAWVRLGIILKNYDISVT